nr:hypothetical protein CKG001_09560 [Bdellovibrio sp. CKG001]BFD62274.1 hypothetical protein BdHM001_09550 [Bdellovibrio sp. HM001]
MQYKKAEPEYRPKKTNAEIAFTVLITTLVFGILVTYFTK